MPEFIKIGIVDVLDILLVALLIYQVYKIIRGSSAVYIFFGIILIYLVWLIVKALDMNLLSTILGQVMGVGVLAIIIVFQPEIRRFLVLMGNRYKDSVGKSSFLRFLLGRSKGTALSSTIIDELGSACSRMSDKSTGALIVLQRSADLGFVIETGDRIDAAVNRRLIENIFFKNTPLHDGAMVISRGRIASVRCTLPMSESSSLPAHFGMRHRAALGLSEQTDAYVIVVSEETGKVSVALDGKLRTLSSLTELRLSLESAF